MESVEVIAAEYNSPQMTNKIRGWDTLEQLGEGGQSEVFKVRRPARVKERAELMKEFSRELLAINEAGIEVGAMSVPNKFGRLIELAYEYARPDKPSELGALKLFKIPADKTEADEAIGRLRNEISLLREGRAGLVSLLDGDDKEHWMVTEFMAGGTLEHQPSRFKGDAYRSLKAFRTLVRTVASLHKDGFIHRDIKPANVFVGNDEELILGDFGIVFVPEQADRLTKTNERVGPRDYMPQWGDLGERLRNPEPNFDVYMLGKLLWCMVSGRLKLPREYHNRPEFDVTTLFKNELDMRVINDILEKCIVEEPADCLASAGELLVIVEAALGTIERGLPMLDKFGKLALPCGICGRGFYQEQAFYGGGHAELQNFDNARRSISPTFLRVFVCNVCTHYEFFAPSFPEEAAKKGWKALDSATDKRTVQ